MKLLKEAWVPDPTECPSLITLKGLFAERQWYMYLSDKICEFSPDNDCEVTCPKQAPRSVSRAGTPYDDDGHDCSPANEENRYVR